MTPAVPSVFSLVCFDRISMPQSSEYQSYFSGLNHRKEKYPLDKLTCKPDGSSVRCHRLGMIFKLMLRILLPISYWLSSKKRSDDRLYKLSNQHEFENNPECISINWIAFKHSCIIKSTRIFSCTFVFKLDI